MSYVNDLQGDIENLTAELERVKALGLDEVDRRLREEAAHAETKARLEKLRAAIRSALHDYHDGPILRAALAETADCEGCGGHCGPELWAQQKKCCPDCSCAKGGRT